MPDHTIMACPPSRRRLWAWCAPSRHLRRGVVASSHRSASFPARRPWRTRGHHPHQQGYNQPTANQCQVHLSEASVGSPAPPFHGLLTPSKMALNASAAEWTPTKQPSALSPAAMPWTGSPLPTKQARPTTPCSPTPKNTVTVDTLPALHDMMHVLCGVQQLAVDCEGVDLSRAGKLCVLIIAAQSASAQTLVWLVDICALGAAAFSTPVVTKQGDMTLKQLLESPAVRKLMWDPRQDSNALWHQYRVHLKNVLCLQVAEVAHRQYVKRHPEVTHVWGLGKCFEVYLPRRMPSDGSRVNKAVMRQLFNTDAQLWTRRPISDLLVRYCSQDVSHLFLLRSLLTAGLDATVMEKVHAHSLVRVNTCFKEEEEANDHMARARAPKL